MKRTKTVKLETNDADGVSLAPPEARTGSHKPAAASVVASEQVPDDVTAADVMTASRTAAIDVSFDGPYSILWDDLAGARPDRIVRAASGRAAQRCIVAGGSKPQLAAPRVGVPPNPSYGG